MEPYTMDRQFHKINVIDGFSSVIWTERYYGDSEIELVLPPTLEMIQKVPVGTFVGMDGSEEVMIIETVDIEPDKLKATGISLLKWLNNRFIRASASHEDKYWVLSGQPAGWFPWAIIYYMCHKDSAYLTGVVDIGIDNPLRLAIPNLNLAAYDTSGPALALAIPYGPVYDAMREIATTYEIGMQLLLQGVTDTSYSLAFRSYKGLDRTSGQTDNPIVRFSPHMDSFTDIKELKSIAAFKTLVYSFAPSNPSGLATTPGKSTLTGADYTGFDLRALMTFEDDITTDEVGGSAPALLDILNSRALDELTNHKYVQAVDGEIVPANQFQYGRDYNLGDVIEVQGNSGVVQTARITEYIRSQDQGGEKAYPTVTMIG